MKRFNNGCFFILAVFPTFIYASNAIEGGDCYHAGVGCDVILKKEKQLDENTYEVSLVDARSTEKIFPYIDSNNTMENVSLKRYEQNYVYLKTYLDSSKALEFIKYKYINGHPDIIKYYYIDSSIDFNGNVKQWAGKECELSTGNPLGTRGDSLFSTYSTMCPEKYNLEFNSNRIKGNDVLFDLTHFVDGDAKDKLSLIALDSKDMDSIDLNDLGCIDHCGLTLESVNYIGKINEKIRVRLHLEFKGDDIAGFYYYDKQKKNITIVGHRNKNKLTLFATVPEGKEVFSGVMDGEQIKGIWSNATGNKKYTFSFYPMLIQ